MEHRDRAAVSSPGRLAGAPGAEGRQGARTRDESASGYCGR